jgi:hypothetical protein
VVVVEVEAVAEEVAAALVATEQQLVLQCLLVLQLQ